MGSADQEPDEAVGGVRKRSHKTIILLAFAASATLFAQPGPAVRQAAAQVGRYRLQSNSWVNLHQRLIHEARFETAPPAALSGDDLSRWKKAVETYRAFLGKRNPIFDRELIGMNAALSETSTPEPPGSIPKAALGALEAAMPLYRVSRAGRRGPPHCGWLSSHVLPAPGSGSPFFPVVAPAAVAGPGIGPGVVSHGIGRGLAALAFAWAARFPRPARC